MYIVYARSLAGRALCLECRVSWVQVPPEAAHFSQEMSCLPWVCCVALPCCLFDLACFFFHLSLTYMYYTNSILYVHTHSPELTKPATSLYLHNLTGTLETAIRATNAQFEDPDILKRLDVQKLELSPGDHGWDVFSLQYHVDGPISTVCTCFNER